MTNHIELTENAFRDQYKPLINHLDPYASFDWATAMDRFLKPTARNSPMCDHSHEQTSGRCSTATAR